LDAGMKYKEMAKRRLDAARTSLEAAAIELRAAERGMDDAERYFKSLRLHSVATPCTNDVVFVEYERQHEEGKLIQNSIDISRCNCISDGVLVEHPRQNEGYKIT
jgi:hypothetical protein